MIGDIRRMYHLQGQPNLSEYIPSLYIKSNYEFDPASDEIEEAVSNFVSAIKKEQLALSRRRKISRNISYRMWKLICYFKNNNHYIIADGDKNLGPYITERSYYIHRGCKEHLSNTRNYRQISRQMAITLQRGLIYRFLNWLDKYRPRRERETPVEWVCISEGQETYLRRAYENYPADKLSRFRMTAKVHKTPWKMRPIVCCVGTLMNAWSKWLDYQLQTLKYLVPTYVKDSQHVLDEIATLFIPPNARLFTTDADAMYNNIDTDHAIQVITWWFRDLDSRNELPPSFPLDAILSAMVIIMKNNIFEWGDLCFLQLLGTAMGTSAAVMWATLYYAYHEVHTILPRHGTSLLYFKRFIDDIFGIWVGNDTTDWTAFCNDIDNFGVLHWDIRTQQLSTSVNFLDLTLTIEGSRIVSRTYQKEMNLYLYIPPASAHSRGCIKGTIYGLVLRYHAQNTYRKDYVFFVKLLYRRLLARGWESSFIRPLIIEACANADRKSSQTTPLDTPTTEEDENRLFIHLVYHPDDIPRQRIQQLYDEHCSELLHSVIGIQRPTIAYKRPKNLGDFITRAKLHEAPGRTASIIMGEFRAGLAPL
jgi:hypothetical protein